MPENLVADMSTNLSISLNRTDSIKFSPETTWGQDFISTPPLYES